MKRILLADDSITIQKVVSITFASEDFDLVIVGDGDAALAKIKETLPNLVMADVAMPGKNGYEVCRAIKNDPTLNTIPVLLLAGTFEPLDEVQAKEAGMDDHIVKPFESEVLIQKVKTLLERGPEAKPAPPTPEPVEVEPVQIEPIQPEPVQPEPVQPAPVQPTPVQPTPPVQPEPPMATPTETKPPVTADIWEAGDFLSPTEEPPGSGGGPADIDVSLQTTPDVVPGGTPMEKPAKEQIIGEEFIDLILAEEVPSEKRPEVKPAPVETPMAPPVEPSPLTEAPVEPAHFTEAPVEHPMAPTVEPSPFTEAPVETPMTAPIAEAPIEAGPIAEGVTVPRDKVEEVISRITRDIIEEIAWEVVPELAEELIKAQLQEKLKHPPGEKK